MILDYEASFSNTARGIILNALSSDTKEAGDVKKLAVVIEILLSTLEQAKVKVPYQRLYKELSK